MHILAANINKAFYNSLADLNDNNEKLTVRGREIAELAPYSLTIIQPWKRVLTIPFRYNNIAATIAETFWVFAGRNDLKFLKFFLPNVIDYSDNGLTWRGGYGERLRHLPYTDDQIRNVIETLKKDIYTRQAIMVIGLPFDYDPDLETKDRPCTMFVQFLFRNGELNCYVYMRSTDVLWGTFNINIFEWTFLQEVVASILRVDIGWYYHTATSFHYYIDKEKRIQKILYPPTERYDVYESINCTTSRLWFNTLNDFYEDIDACMNIIEKAMDNPNEIEIDSIVKSVGLRDYLKVIITYILAQRYSLYDGAYRIINDIEGFDTRIAGLELLFRTMVKKNKMNTFWLPGKLSKTKLSEQTKSFIFYSQT